MKLVKLAVGAALAGALIGTEAHAIDIAPGDYAYLPAGTNLFIAYFDYAQSSSFKTSNGIKVPNSSVSSTVGIARYLHYTDIGGSAFLFQAVLPFGTINSPKVGGVGLTPANGLGDLTLGATYYPIHSNAPTGTTIGLTAFTVLPTGNYDVNNPSLGSGTATFIPQIGFIQGLGNGFFLDGAVEADFSVDHTNSGIKVHQNTSYEAQAFLRYQFSQATSVSFGYAGKFGGQFYANGVKTPSMTREDTLKLFANTFVTKDIQLQGMIGTDVAATGGFKNSVIAEIRIAKVF